jgi:hypothetical protein
MHIGTYMRRNIMPQLHFYVPDDVAEQIKARAARAHLSISRYVADLVKRDVGQGWPKDYFERISDVVEGAAIGYEPSVPSEERLPLK